MSTWQRVAVRPIVLLSASIVAGTLMGASEGLRTVAAESYLDHGLYRIAAETFFESGRGAWLRAAGTTLGVLLVATLLVAAKRRFSRGPGRPVRVESPGRLTRALSVGVVAAALGLAAVGAGLSAYASWPVASDQRNVVLIVIDTLRADHVGAYGYDGATTPRLDAFAEDAFLFSNAYSASSWTRPSIASILTSTLPVDHRITTERRSDVLQPRFTTMQELFRDRGYQTAAFVTNPHYRRGMDGGFHHFTFNGNLSAAELYPQVGGFLDEVGDEPFFLLVHNNDPHDTYEYREGFSVHPPDSPYRELHGLFPSHQDGARVSLDSDEHRSGIRRLDDAAMREMRENYDGEIAYLDHFLGEFLDDLERRGLSEHTIVAIVADHGEEFLDHGGYWHGGTLYDELIRVPFMLRVPGLRRREISTRVGTVDLFPTLLDLLGDGGRLAGQQRGRSLVPLMRGETLRDQPLLGVTAFRGSLKYSLVLGDTKLIRYADGEVIGLFDLAADPREEFDLSAARPDRVRALDAMLQELIGDAFARSAAGVPGLGRQAATAIDPEIEQAMRALGYVEVTSSK